MILLSGLADEYSCSEYDVISQLSENMTLLRSRGRGRLVMRKKTDSNHADIYRELEGLTIKGLPKVISVINNADSCFVLYEYIEGLTVKEYVENNGAIPQPVVYRYISDICDALSDLHAMGIVHRDITPANVVIARDGHCYLLDLGIARHIKADVSADTEILGTAGFASPEQFGFRQTDARSDIYSVGILMHYMLTGAMPGAVRFDGAAGEVIKKCTEMDPQNRYASAKELKEAITSEKAPMRKRHRVSVIVLGLIFVFLIPYFLSDHSGAEKLEMFFSYFLIVFVPVAAVTDLFGIIDKLAAKYEWRRQERIGIRVFIILSACLLVTIIDNFIQTV